MSKLKNAVLGAAAAFALAGAAQADTGADNKGKEQAEAFSKMNKAVPWVLAAAGVASAAVAVWALKDKKSKDRGPK